MIRNSAVQTRRHVSDAANFAARLVTKAGDVKIRSKMDEAALSAQARGDTAIVAHHGLFRCALDATERAYADARLKSAQSVLGKTQVSAPAVEHCRTGERPMGQHASQIKTAS